MDRTIIQVQFKKALWVCPKCGQEDIEDFNIGGGNTYEHNCSACNAWFNSFKEFHSSVNYTEEEYNKLDPIQIDTDKQTAFTNWVTQIKNPPVYVEPSKEDLQQLYEAKLQETQNCLDSLAEKSTPEELGVIKEAMTAKVVDLQSQIATKSAIIEAELVSREK